MDSTVRPSFQRHRKKLVTEGTMGCNGSTLCPWHQRYYFVQMAEVEPWVWQLMRFAAGAEKKFALRACWTDTRWSG